MTIAYLAPEIPALSATFVYQEIIQLEALGHTVKPVSIHRPANPARSAVLDELEKRTYFLYEQSTAKVVAKNLALLASSPILYLTTLKTVISDSNSVGYFSHVGRGLFYRFFIAAGFVSYLKNNKIKHIHANFAHIPTDIAMYASLLSNISFSFTSHANDLFERGWLLKQKVARSKFAVTISQYNKAFLQSKGADAKKINVIHCGVDTKSFSHRGEHKPAVPPLLGALGRMVEKKGFEVLINACNILKNDGVTFKLQIAGGGPLKDELEALASDLDLASNIEFIDAISHEKVPDWIKSLDAFILPCKEDEHGDMDGIPVVLMEAMLTGVPVISTRISGIPELIVDELTGLLCEPGDSNCLANNINRLISNPDLRNKLCANAVTKVKTDFELSKNVELLSRKLID